MPLAQILPALTNRIVKYSFLVSLAFVCCSFLTDNKELSIGSQAPDFSAKLYNGKDFKLSSLRGSYTLVQFWASWDLPSLKLHNSFIKTYQKYKDAKFSNGKKFNIVMVSIDQKPETYQIAIARENLPWPYLVCDFDGWGSKIINTYQVENIPCNFLINPNGVIVSKNLFDDNLELELKKYLNK
jgi:peroxiredoxin